MYLGWLFVNNIFRYLSKKIFGLLMMEKQNGTLGFFLIIIILLPPWHLFE